MPIAVSLSLSLILPDQYFALIALQLSAHRTSTLRSATAVHFHSHPSSADVVLHKIAVREFVFKQLVKRAPELTFLKGQDGLELNGTQQRLVCADVNTVGGNVCTVEKN
jgi:hypothetical protein